MSDYHDPADDTMLHYSQDLEDTSSIDAAAQESGHNSPGMPEWDTMGLNGTGLRNFAAAEPDSGGLQVQNPAEDSMEWDGTGINGAEMDNFSPDSPTGSGSQSPVSETDDDGDDSEITYAELVHGLLDYLRSSDAEPENSDKSDRQVTPLTDRQLVVRLSNHRRIEATRPSTRSGLAVWVIERLCNRPAPPLGTIAKCGGELFTKKTSLPRKRESRGIGSGGAGFPPARE